MSAFYGGEPFVPASVWYEGAPGWTVYRGGVRLAAGPAPPSRRVAFVGDSTVAEYPTGSGITPIGNLVSGVIPTTLAVPGHTIAQQHAVWSAQSGVQKQSYGAVVIQVGLNDVTSGGNASAAIARLQALVTLIRSDVAPACKIIVSRMIPCAQRWFASFGGVVGGNIGQQLWSDINEAIAGGGPTPITAVDARVVDHVPLQAATLSLTYNGQTFDQPWCLEPEFESMLNDHIHHNNLSRQVNADQIRLKIFRVEDAS